VHTYSQAKGDDIALLTTPKHKQHQQQHGGSLSRPSSVRGFFAGLFKDKEKGGSSSATNSSSRQSTANDDNSGTGVAIGRRLSASAHTATAAVSLVSATLLLSCFTIYSSVCNQTRLN
jgi:hypothetical protein